MRRKFGWNPARSFLKWMKDLIEAKLGNRYITFKEVCLVLKESAWRQTENSLLKKMINMVLDLLVLFESVLSILCFDLNQSFPRVLKLGSLK